jgi:hypothetical protein
MNIRPLYDRIVVQRIEEQESARNGIVIPGSAKERPKQGEVMAMHRAGSRTAMNKRLLKRHNRQVARAKARVRPSEPDVRTSEQRLDAREMSRSVRARSNGPRANYFTTSIQSDRIFGTHTGTKAEAAL